MVEQYRHTFLGVQVLTLGVTAWVYFGVSHWWGAAAAVFVTMQVSGVIGAIWAGRLRKRMQSNPLF